MPLANQFHSFVTTLVSNGITAGVGGGNYGVAYAPAGKTKAELYGLALPLINSGRAELLDHPRLVVQLCGLERRTAWGGRDSIDHGPGGRDDLANAVAGALVVASQPRAVPAIRATLIRVPIRRSIPWRELE